MAEDLSMANDLSVGMADHFWSPAVKRGAISSMVQTGGHGMGEIVRLWCENLPSLWVARISSMSSNADTIICMYMKICRTNSMIFVINDGFFLPCFKAKGCYYLFHNIICEWLWKLSAHTSLVRYHAPWNW